MTFVFAVVATIEGVSSSKKRPIAFDADHDESVLVHLAFPKYLGVEEWDSLGSHN